jgi:mannose-6-phosphate isomerase-like protein (cupin superfamily)
MGAWVTAAEQRLGRDEIARLLSRYGKPSWWSNGAHDQYAPHQHPYHKVLYCVAGSIIFHVDDENHHLASGDRLDIEPGTEHSASVGPEGVQCGEVAVDDPGRVPHR